MSPALARRIAVAALMGLLSGCARLVPPDTNAPNPLALAVVTWNMHAGAGDVAALTADLRAGRLTDAPVGDFVLLLQEATPAIAAFAEQQRLASAYRRIREGPALTTGNAILSTRPLTGVRSIDLPRERQPRGAVAAEIEVGGVPLFVVSAHLENRLGWLRGLFGDRARQRQAAALVAAVPPGHGIVGGDMNTMLGPNEPALRALMARFADTPRQPPAPTFRNRLTLDHLFFDLPDGWTASRLVAPGTYRSDHHPVIGLVSRPRE